MAFPHTLYVLQKFNARHTNIHTENFHFLGVQRKEKAGTKLLTFSQKNPWVVAEKISDK